MISHQIIEFFLFGGGMEGGEEGPEGEGGGDGDVEGVLGAVLRDFEADVGGVDCGLTHAVDLVADDDGVASGRVGAETVEGDAPLYNNYNYAVICKLILKRG